MLSFLRKARIRRLLRTREIVGLAWAMAALSGDDAKARAFKADRDAINHSLWLAGWRPNREA